MNRRIDEYNQRRRVEIENTQSRAQLRRVPPTTRNTLRQQPCRNCQAEPIEIHHIVPQAHFGKRDETRHHQDNLMPLCHRCHQDHHTTTKRIPHHRLLVDEYSFAVRKMGEGWVEKWYPKTQTVQ